MACGGCAEWIPCLAAVTRVSLAQFTGTFYRHVYFWLGGKLRFRVWDIVICQPTADLRAGLLGPARQFWLPLFFWPWGSETWCLSTARGHRSHLRVSFRVLLIKVRNGHPGIVRGSSTSHRTFALCTSVDPRGNHTHCLQFEKWPKMSFCPHHCILNVVSTRTMKLKHSYVLVRFPQNCRQVLPFSILRDGPWNKGLDSSSSGKGHCHCRGLSCRLT